MRELIFDLSISAEDYLAVYQGAAKDVVAVSRNGLTVRFPANILRRYVTRTGIQGSFAVLIDEQNRFQSIRLL